MVEIAKEAGKSSLLKKGLVVVGAIALTAVGAVVLGKKSDEVDDLELEEIADETIEESSEVEK